MSDATTFILRFRDLVTESGGTISRHMDLIRDRQAVWWAWWRKAGETVPVDEMRRLRTIARGAGLAVYLHDSGQNKLYAATCRDIDWTVEPEGKASPEDTLTPDYYRQRQYMMWFKFSHISELPDPKEVLQKLTYVQVGSMFETGVSRYAAFYGKAIDDSEELTEQNRTIWFVREWRIGDRTGRHVLLDAAINISSQFPKQRIETASTNVLWLSDIHFSTATTDSPHTFAMPNGVSSVHRVTLSGAIVRDFPDARFAAILVSGDITWRAGTDEFLVARRELQDVMNDTGMDATRLIVVPGNHDLAYSKNPDDLSSQVEFATVEARSAYTQFYYDLYHEPPSEHLAMGRHLLLSNGVLVDIVALNSSALQQAPNRLQGHGYVGDEQLRMAARAMGWTDGAQKRRVFRIVMLHHHLVPMNYMLDPERLRGFSVSLDAEAIMRWLVEHRVDLVLHGHMHEPGIVRVEKPIDRSKPDAGWYGFTIAGMGTTGAHAEALTEVGKNTVGLLDFQDDAVEVRIQTIHPSLPSTSVWKTKVSY
jgi:predicted phosphodiesterase